MKTTIKYILLVAIMALAALPAAAQSACDNLYNKGLQAQQTMTIASQNSAISYFQKAKNCYDSQANKTKCDQQIKVCRDNITNIQKKGKKATPSAEAAAIPAPEPEPQRAATAPAAPARDVQLSIDCAYIKFKAKGGEYKKAKVICNYPDWEVSRKPDWVKCFKNDDNEVIVECEKNTTGEERNGNIEIQCGDKTATFMVIQDKSKKLGLF